MNSRILLLISALAIFTFNGCKDDNEPGQFQLKTIYTVDDDDLVFDQFIYESPTGYSYSVITLRYYLSRLRLRHQNGSYFDLSDVIYFDGRNGDKTIVSFGDIPPGPYSAFEFVFGLDEAMNIDGGLENTIENINMEWPIPGDQGYHYMKYEGKYTVEAGGEVKSFNLHTGATGGNQNFITVSLPLASPVIENGIWQLELKMDLGEWLKNPTVYDFEQFGSAIMMNQAAQEVLKANGSTVFSVESIHKING